MKIHAYQEEQIRELVGHKQAKGITIHDLAFVENLESSALGYGFQFTQEISDVEKSKSVAELKFQLEAAEPYQEVPDVLWKAKMLVSVIEAKNKVALQAMQLMHELVDETMPTPYDSFVSYRINKEAEVNRIIHCLFALPVTEQNMDLLNEYHGLSDCARQHVRRRRLMMFTN